MRGHDEEFSAGPPFTGKSMRYGDGFDMPNKHKALKKALALAEKKQKHVKNQTPNRQPNMPEAK
jgi:hypothetical protein